LLFYADIITCKKGKQVNQLENNFEPLSFKVVFHIRQPYYLFIKNCYTIFLIVEMAVLFMKFIKKINLCYVANNFKNYLQEA